MTSRTSRRTHCPHCDRPSAITIADLFASEYGEYFVCVLCHEVWMVPMGKDGPAMDVLKRPVEQPNRSARP